MYSSVDSKSVIVSHDAVLVQYPELYLNAHTYHLSFKNKSICLLHKELLGACAFLLPDNCVNLW